MNEAPSHFRFISRCIRKIERGRPTSGPFACVGQVQFHRQTRFLASLTPEPDSWCLIHLTELPPELTPRDDRSKVSA